MYDTLPSNIRRDWKHDTVYRNVYLHVSQTKSYHIS